MNAYCTIISPDYLPFARTLHRSLQKWQPGTAFHVLVTGPEESLPDELAGDITINTLSQLNGTSLCDELIGKYGRGGDPLRWAIKPVYLDYLLTRYEKVVYADCDIHFFADPSFILQELEGHSILLSPHHGLTDPFEDEQSFRMNFTAGLYNAGFIAVTRQAASTLKWWAAACLSRMERDPANGYFDDQRYLDAVPAIDDQAVILRHRGCNLGSWNIRSCPRSLVNGSVMISNRYPVVFVHFNKETLQQILNRNDALLRPFLDEYIRLLHQNGYDLLKNLPDIPVKKYDSALYTFKHKIRLRTRLKRFFHRLAEKL